MLPKLINYNYTRSTRDVNTNFPNSLNSLYSSISPRQATNQLPPIISPTHANTDSHTLKKALYEKKLMRDISTHRETKERLLKGRIVERFWQDFNIFLNQKCLAWNVSEVLEQGFYLFQVRRMSVAAEKIQKHWKAYTFGKAIENMKIRRHIAARKIQRTWKSFYKMKVLPKFIEENREKAALVIQRYFRGYSARMKYFLVLNRKKLKSQLKYFDEICDQVKLESIIIIQKYWRKYKIRKDKNKNKPAKKNIGKRFAQTVRLAKNQRKITKK